MIYIYIYTCVCVFRLKTSCINFVESEEVDSSTWPAFVQVNVMLVFCATPAELSKL